jgi:hypothetical protein
MTSYYEGHQLIRLTNMLSIMLGNASETKQGTGASELEEKCFEEVVSVSQLTLTLALIQRQ